MSGTCPMHGKREPYTTPDHGPTEPGCACPRTVTPDPIAPDVLREVHGQPSTRQYRVSEVKEIVYPLLERLAAKDALMRAHRTELDAAQDRITRALAVLDAATTNAELRAILTGTDRG